MRSRLELILDDLKDNRLTRLSLTNATIDTEGIKCVLEALKHNNSVKTLNLRHNSLGDMIGIHVDEVLKENKSITKMNLEYTKIGAAGAKYICEALKTNNHVTSMNLQDNNIGDSGAKYICDVLKINSRLIELYFLDNSMSDACVTYFIEALKSNYTLVHTHDWIDNTIKNLIQRNKSFAECVNPLLDDIGRGMLGKGREVETALASIPSLIDDFNTLADDSYPVEVYRLLTGVGHLTSFDKIDALTCLLPAFKQQHIQRLANLVLGQLLAMNSMDFLTEHNQEQAGNLLAIHCLNNSEYHPESKTFEQIAWFRLLNGHELLLHEKDLFETEIKRLSQDEFRGLLKTALAECLQDDFSRTQEIKLLNILLSSNAHTHTLPTACLSLAFENAFKDKYPKAQFFTTFEHYLSNIADKQHPLLVNFYQPPIFIDIQKQLKHYTLQSDPVIKLIDKVKRNISQICFDLLNTTPNKEEPEVKTYTASRQLFFSVNPPVNEPDSNDGITFCTVL